MYYYLFLLILLPFVFFSAWASAKVNTTFSAFDKVANSSHMTGYDTAVRLLQRNGIDGMISVNCVRGKLTDHYKPSKAQVNLSQSTYGSASVAAVAVAAHEIGHVMQRQTGYVPYRIRAALAPAATIGSRLALSLILLGIGLDAAKYAVVASTGFWIMCVGIAFYALSTLFSLVTLPVEFNASKRARIMLVEEGILTENEIPGARRVLTAAAMTYVASMCVALVYLLRYVFLILAASGRKR